MKNAGFQFAPGNHTVSFYDFHNPSTMVVNGVELKRAGLAEKKEMDAGELNAMGWTIDNSMSQSRSQQVQGVKDMLFKDMGASGKIGGDVQRMDREMQEVCDQFFRGELNETQLADRFQRFAEDFLTLCKEKGYPVPVFAGSLTDVKLSVVYDHFRSSILKAAVAANQAEGQRLASSKFGWRYYNADYYEQSERAIAAVSQRVKEIAGQKGIGQFEIPDYKALGKNSLYNFNSAVSKEPDYIPGSPVQPINEKWILDFDQAPPKGFQYFYEEGSTEPVMHEGDQVPEGLEAKVWASFRDLSGKLQTLSKSFFYSVTQDSPSDVKNLGDLLSFRPASKKEFRAANAFLKSFQAAPSHYFSQKAQRENRHRCENCWDVKA